MRLSILICSLKNRTENLNKLLSMLNGQINCSEYLLKNTEILVEVDSGELPTGTKRNILLNRAKGDYICFIDDDDLVSDDYIGKIFKAIEQNPDCCSLEGEITFKRSGITKKFIHSLQYKSWFEENNIYYRNPNHLNAVKRDLALQARFPEKTIGEDFDYSMKLLPLLKTEFRIPGIIYYYLTS